MRPFLYSRATTASEAFRVASAAQVPTHYLAGGTNLIDYMKLDVVRPEAVIDINDLASQFGAIEAGGQGLRLGALVRMSQAARHPTIRRDYPVIAQALDFAASPQLRNMASLGGNVLQRTRCSYFRDTSWLACNKRTPGSGCAALEGIHNRHAVLGTSDQCIATYAGDFAQALVALGAKVEILGANGMRSLEFEALHQPAGSKPAC